MSIAKKVVNEILDHGLADCTWREKFPEAYKSLLEYREDLEASVEMFIPLDEWDIKTGFIIRFHSLRTDELLILDGTAQDVRDYKKWYAIHNKLKMNRITHSPTHIVTRKKE